MYMGVWLAVSDTVPPEDSGVASATRDLDFTTLQILMFLVTVTIVTGLFVFALLKAAEHAPPIGLVISLSVLSLVSILAAVGLNNSDFTTLAATGIGALAGAVSATYQAMKTIEMQNEQLHAHEVEIAKNRDDIQGLVNGNGAGEQLPRPTDPEDTGEVSGVDSPQE